MTTAVAYLRVSGKSQLDGNGFERQIKACQDCAISHDLALINEYREEAIPGKFDEDQRPAFQTMIAELLGNGCRTIIIESLDRLAREYRVQEQLIIYIASKGLTLIAANTGEDITAAMMGDPMKRALVQIQGIFSELDKNMLVAKLRKARERKRGNGKHCEGSYPYGHDPRRLEEHEVLTRIMKLASDGIKPENIADMLNDYGTSTRGVMRNGILIRGSWRASLIRKIVRREVKE